MENIPPFVGYLMVVHPSSDVGNNRRYACVYAYIIYYNRYHSIMMTNDNNRYQ